MDTKANSTKVLRTQQNTLLVLRNVFCCDAKRLTIRTNQATKWVSEKSWFDAWPPTTSPIQWAPASFPTEEPGLKPDLSPHSAPRLRMSQTTLLPSLTRLRVSQLWATLPLHHSSLLKRGRTEDQNSVIEIRCKDLANKINKRNGIAILLAVLRTLRVANVTESTTEIHKEYLWPSKQKTLSQIVVAAEIFCI
jgi:hypothetical protein